MYLPYKYIEEEDFEKGFAQHYEEHIVPLAQKHDRKRPQRLLIDYTNIFAALTSGLGTSFFIFKSVWFAKYAQSSRKAGQILLLPPMFFWWLIVHLPRRKYFQAIKKELVPEILKFYGVFKYSESGEISKRILYTHTSYTPLLNSFSCEDIISFKKDDLSCTIVEKTYWDMKQPLGKVFMYIKSNYSFDIDAVIISKTRARLADKKILKRRKLTSKSALISPIFNKNFRMHTNDLRINKLLSENFINTLNHLNSVYDQDGLVFSIKDNEIFIELESKGNLFEIGEKHNVAVANSTDIRNFLHELTATFKLIETITQTLNEANLIRRPYDRKNN